MHKTLDHNINDNDYINDKNDLNTKIHTNMLKASQFKCGLLTLQTKTKYKPINCRLRHLHELDTPRNHKV